MIDCVPTGKELVFMVATALAFKLPVPSAVAPSRNVTVPVGTLPPDCGETVAVKVTLCPVSMAVAELARTVLVTEVMMTVRGCDVEPASSESPPYEAVIESDPAGRVVLVKLAVPLEPRVAVPKELLPL